MVMLEALMSLRDNFSNPVKKTAENMRSLGETAENTAPKFDKIDGGLGKAKRSSDKLRDSMSKVLPVSEQNANAQKKHNDAIQDGEREANKLTGALKGVLGVAALIAAGKKFIDFSNEITSATSRLALMNDGQQKVTEFNDEIFKSAERARGSYMATADTIAKLGLQTGDLFKSNKELITFAEVLNKQFKIAGTPIESQKSAMLQLTQAMGSGVLRGEEFNAIFEASPAIIELIAKKMNMPASQMRSLAAEGKITADVVKSSLLDAIDETSEKFNQMPKTFGDIAESFKNRAIKAFTPVALQFNKLINSKGFQAMFDVATRSVEVFANGLMFLLAVSENVFNFLYDSWPLLKPLFFMVGGAILAVQWKVIQGFVLMGLQAMKMGALAVIAGLKTAAAFVIANLPIVLLGAAIGFVIYLLVQLGATAGDVCGFIVGAFFAVLQIILNFLMFIPNLIVSVAELIYNTVKDIQTYFLLAKNNIQGAWEMMCYSLHRNIANFVNGGIKMVESFVNFFIRGINKIIQGINRLSFTTPSWLGGYTFGIHKDEISEWSAPRMAMPDAPKIANGVKPREYTKFPKAEYGSVGNAFNIGKDVGKNFGNFVSDKVGGIGDFIRNAKDSVMGDLNNRGVGKMPKPGEGLDPLDAGAGGKGKAGKALKDTAKNTKDIDSALRRSSDDLSAIKDLMTQRAITNISWDKIEVKVDNKFGDIHKEVDLDGFIDSIGEGLNNAVNSVMTGVTLLE